jgi:hypothetical protein
MNAPAGGQFRVPNVSTGQLPASEPVATRVVESFDPST